MESISEFQSSVEKNRQYKKTLAKAFWRLASLYSLTQKEQAGLLGLKENRSRLNKLKDRQELPEDPDKYLRVSHLIGIHKNLKILFPHNREVAYGWMKSPRELFGGQSAVDYILSDYLRSLPRLASVRRVLDQIRVGG